MIKGLGQWDEYDDEGLYCLEVMYILLFQFCKLPIWGEILILRGCFFWKHFLILKLYRKPHLNSVFGLSFSVIGRFSPVPALIGCSKKILLDLNGIGSFLRNFFSGPQAGLRNHFFRVIGSFMNATTSSWKRVTEMIFRISKCFQRRKSKHQIWFSLQQGIQKF
jgi:hypothetical protein